MAIQSIIKTALDFSVITDKSDQKDKRNDLNQRLGQAGKDFEMFVVSSVYWFYGASDKNINVINDLLEIAHKSRGMNAARLAAYLKHVIPHKLTEAKTTKDCPKFGVKIKDTVYPVTAQWSEFLRRNPQWSKYGKVSKSTDFDLQKYLKGVVSTLKSHKVDESVIRQMSIVAGIEYKEAV